MKKLLYLAGFIAVAIVIVVVIYSEPRYEEPSYQGFTLSEWLAGRADPYIVVGAEIKVNKTAMQRFHGRADSYVGAGRAVKALGTNALPTLIRWLRIEKSPVKEWLGYVISRSYSSSELHLMAAEGFHMLGEDARPAVPALIELTKHKEPEVRLLALFILVEDIGLDSETGRVVLATLLNDPDRMVRKQAELYSEWHFFSERPEKVEESGAGVPDNVQHE